MNTAIKYANENGIEALKEAMPASFKPSANESIVLDGVRINLTDAFEVIAANDFVEKFNALPCLYDDLAEKARYFEIVAEVEK